MTFQEAQDDAIRYQLEIHCYIIQESGRQFFCAEDDETFTLPGWLRVTAPAETSWEKMSELIDSKMRIPSSQAKKTLLTA